ncbi:MAG TPA: FAD-binding oxidoreductase, partial [Candidatus Saccharimonadales bacterium]|nr:FAD-binding oxidoreductase [Candidatus Saccharimonadales bacterium]
MALNTKEIEKLIDGEVDTSKKAKDFYSHDASMFELRPEAVVFPANSEDIQKLVKYADENKAKNPDISITARSGGTCMSGGAINESIIIDMTKHFNNIEEVDSKSARVQPGVYYRNFEA